MRLASKRSVSLRGAVRTALEHESSRAHVSGSARYLDDLPEPEGLLHLYFGVSERAHARICSLDLAEVKAFPGVVDVITAEDIPGTNDLSVTNCHDEPLLPHKVTMYQGQALFFVVAQTRLAARQASALARVVYEDLPATTSLSAARAKEPDLVCAPMTLKRGKVAKALARARHRTHGRMEIGGQDHLYLEGQIAMACPGEGDEIEIVSSTQHAAEIQTVCARVLGLCAHKISVKVRRMGGGFGGKETQGSFFAAAAALAARRVKAAVKFRPHRDDDMRMTGKRHPFSLAYEVGYDETGRIEAVDVTHTLDCGFSSDLSGPVSDRALMHADNAYYFPSLCLKAQPLRTHLASNTAFRGFGGPQGILGAERLIEEIAYTLGVDPLEVRRRNFYDPATGRARTPYGQPVEDFAVPDLVEELASRTDYAARRADCITYNRTQPHLARGIALVPVKFGISFTKTENNQASAVVMIYSDGTVGVHHGGAEMGQGLHTKIMQVVATTLSIDVDRVRVLPTSTDAIPNAPPTAGSAGSDLNGMAALRACETLKRRLAEVAATHFGVAARAVRFAPNAVHGADKRLTFDELVSLAFAARVQLFADGHYATPNISWSRASGTGRPYYYFACGACVAEVAVEAFTGATRLLKVDILHDAGASLNPAIDKGQIEGAFVQGFGWLTSEELKWDEKGALLSHAPSTYKIPLACDVPEHFRVELRSGSSNAQPTIYRSKAIGEPPFMLSIAAFEAIGMAVASFGDYKVAPRLDAPATPERVLMRIEELRGEAARLKA